MTPSRRSQYALDHVVDAASVEGLRTHIRSIALPPRRLDLECGAVHAVDPVGAALLWLLCTELERRGGTHMRLVNLPVPVAQRLRSHPLSHYVVYGEEMFHDPFSTAVPSNR